VQDLVIPLQRIPELFRGAPKGPSRTLTREELAHFGISIKPASGFVRVARVHRPGAAKPLTIWQPVERGLTSGRAVVVLGHHASTAPDAMPARGAAMVVEIRDDKRSASSFRADASARLQAALDQVLPPPERYICIWHVVGPEPLCIWTAVPPSKDFVALGAIATATGPDQQPPLDAMRCVPRTWTAKAAAPELVWEGADGCIWQAAAMGVLLPTRGRSKPELVLELDPRKLKAPEPR